MAKLLELNKIVDERGDLTVIEEELGFDIKRVFYIYNVNTNSVRGGHSHKKNKQALIAVSGSCEVIIRKKDSIKVYLLDAPSKCLVLNPEDWHTMEKFKNNCVLLSLASEKYDENDYVYEVLS